MAQQNLQNYLKAIRDTLDATLNLRYFPSELVERQTHPEVEFQDNAKLLMKPLLLSKSEQEKCLVEASINSVRVSISIKKNQDIEVFKQMLFLLTHMLERFLALRADKFQIMRKKPAHEGFDFSFLITDEHCMKFKKEELINFILEFIQGIDKEINDMKLAIINQTRIAAAFTNLNFFCIFEGYVIKYFNSSQMLWQIILFEKIIIIHFEYDLKGRGKVSCTNL